MALCGCNDMAAAGQKVLAAHGRELMRRGMDQALN
jgi:hypothetical protein